MDTALSPPVGQLLGGRYHVGSRIARGGMATVYLGTDTRLDRVVALKIAHPEFSDDAEFVRRFIGEARSAARLSNPNVVAIYDQGSDRRLHYIAMEYVPGRTLRQLLNERGRLDPREALDIMTGVLSGLAAAHQAGLAHRDVKPENVLLTSNGGVKVADFGLARSVAGAVQTKGGMIIGTAAYLAPEQVAGRASDARTDVYAAGVMLFELLTGRQPHTGESPLAVAYKHVNEVVPPPSSVLPGIPPPLDALVALTTSRDPELRPAHAGQFLRAIQEIRNGPALTGAGPHPTPGGTSPYPLSGSGAPRQDAYPHQAAGGSGPLSREPLARDAYGYPQGGERAPSGIPLGHDRFDSARYDSSGYPRPGFDRGAVGASALPSLSPQAGVVVPPNLPAEARQVTNHTLIVPAGDPLHGYHPASADGYPGAQYRYGGTGYRSRRRAKPPAEPWLQNMLFSRRIIYAGAGLAIAVLLAFGGWWLFTGRYATIPRISGMALRPAERELTALGLSVRLGTAEHSDLPKGTVVATTPKFGSRVPHGSWVTVVESLGPVMIQVPDVTGQPLASAEAALTAAHLTYGPVTKSASDTVPVGVVISTTPPAYTSWPQDKPVTITVSAGPGLPDFVGMQLPDAEAAAQQGGYKINAVEDQQGSQPANTITSQSPQAGTPITPGEIVTVHYSPGPPKVQVPDVQGMNVNDATKLLQAAGFQVSVNHMGPGNNVGSYSPQGLQPKGTVITLNVGFLSGFGATGGQAHGADGRATG